MSKPTILFLWHMHQPSYLDALNGTYLMPWVRLHATKGYYDIPLAMKNSGVKGTINMVPSLIEQLQAYSEGNASDRWLTVTMPHPRELSDDDKVFLVRSFMMLHWDRQVRTSPRYYELLRKRQRYEKKISFEEMISFFSDDELLDLQVLFNLKWFGFMAKENYPFLQTLEDKDRFFTQDDKQQMMAIQKEIIASIIPLYRDLIKNGDIEVSFTPFYHPIFPLVHNTALASRSMPHAPLPSQFSFPEDALWHLKEGKRYASEVWGTDIDGMWPAEGSVSPELIKVAEQQNVKWIATDEDILFKSIGSREKRHICRPWKLGEHSPALFFRDKYLSDMVGFSFSTMEANDAVNMFVNYARSVFQKAAYDTPLLPIILDGENAWESYPENGKQFLTHLFDTLAKAEDLTCATFSETLKQDSSYNELITLHTGSWIDSDFHIWIGSEDKNNAWDYLRRVRLFWSRHQSTHFLSEKIVEEVNRTIYRAEGSDWFWWYGDHFSTENDSLFDRLFRRHLRKVYSILGLKSPTFLNIPILSRISSIGFREPTVLISPKITGKTDNFFKWNGAGILEVSKRPGGAMFNSNRIADRIAYGFNKESIFIKVTLLESLRLLAHKKMSLRVFFMNGHNIDITLPLIPFSPAPFSAIINNETGPISDFYPAGKAACDDILEFSFNFSACGVPDGETLSLYFKILSEDGKELERIPVMGGISLHIPSDRDLHRYWDV
ncbi:hypothetical protein KAH37_00265 [bacterium]|nr:hypothetical protein [bacterium]